MYNLLVEAIIVGFVCLALGLLINKIFRQQSIYFKLFVIGFSAHLIFEGLSINKWYCTNGNACVNI